MYEDRYGTDWTDLDAAAAIERAYALGVLAGLGDGLPDEYERVRGAVGNGTADMVELAYEEGRRAVTAVPAEGSEAAWEALVANADDRFVRQDGDDGGEPASAPPSSLSALEPPDDDPGMLDLPAFLRRD